MIASIGALASIGLAALAPPSGGPQDFRDDFDGTALHARWKYYSLVTEGTTSVASGQWSATAIANPPETRGAFVHYATLGPTNDITIRARVGWDTSTGSQVFIWMASESPYMKHRYATFSSYADGSTRRLLGQAQGGTNYAGTTGGSGYAELEIAKVGGTVTFRVGGTQVHQTSAENVPIRLVGFGAGTTALTGYAPVHVDWFEIVTPTPGLFARTGLAEYLKETTR